jgi:hypothetical protein
MRFGLSSPVCKNISLRRSAKSLLCPPPSRPTQRGVAQRHERGTGCSGRGWCQRRGCLKRTAKTCGPDAPTLASSWWKQFRLRRWQKSPVTEESTEETVKTIARGMPDVSGVTVVTNACAYYHYARGCGRAERPAFPAPSDWRVRKIPGKTRAKHAAGMRTDVSICVIARSGATKQSISPRKGRMDCFAALAKTVLKPH